MSRVLCGQPWNDVVMMKIQYSSTPTLQYSGLYQTIGKCKLFPIFWDTIDFILIKG